MNMPELRAELARKNITIPQFAKYIGISKKAMYDRFNGKVAFRQNEITKAREMLELSDDKIMLIFFS